VQEAACSDRVVVLKTREPGRTSYVVVGGGGAGLLGAEARRAIWGGRLPAGSVRQRAREDALIGARVLGIEGGQVFIEQEGAARVLRTERGRVVVTDAAPPPGLEWSEDPAELEARGADLARALAEEVLAARRVDVGRVLSTSADRIERRRKAILGDLEKIEQADRIAAQAQWLVAEAARAPRGATELVVTDWSTGEAVPMRVPLDPSKSAKDQVAVMFKRAKRLRLGGRIAEERLAQTEGQLAAIARAREEAASAASLVDLENVLQRAKRAAPRDVTLPSATTISSKEAPARTAYRSFFARSGLKLLVGKGAADNDELTLHVARPHDLWLHAKDRTGAHVIVPLDKGKTCPSEDLVDGAHLAAHFSDAREEAVVDVQYTHRRHLRKPKGSPPGFVIVDREKVLVLRVEAQLLKNLLQSEV
jgi:predicted ribosome quality control (RQC) complex YloA/Tae2 family protein